MVGCLGIVAATSGYGYSRGMEYQRQITDTGELQRVIRQVGTSGKRIGDAVKKSCNNLGKVLRK